MLRALRPHRSPGDPPSSASRRKTLAWAPALIVAAGCAGALGIEDAVCDSTYSPECGAVPGGVGGRGGAAPRGGAGGSAATGGLDGSSGSALVTAGAGGGEGLPPAGEDPLCAQYCDLVASACVDSHRQYASRAACLAVCGLLEPGQPGDTRGNTVHCRSGRAMLAASTGEPGDYCFSAGPGGAGVCGSDCEAYCTLMTAQCSELGSGTQCLTACERVPDLSRPPNDERFNTDYQSGDSLQCRLFHVSAATLDPAGHCVHAAGIAVCNANP